MPSYNSACAISFIQINSLVNLNEFSIGSTKVEGDLKELNLSKLSIFSVSMTDIYGNLSDNKLSNVYYWVNPPKISGTTAQILDYVPKTSHFSFEHNTLGNMTGSVEELAECAYNKGLIRNINLANLRGISFHNQIQNEGVTIKCVATQGLITLTRDNITVATYDGTTWKDGDGNPYTPNS